jgi:hygromycin-B 4-O-kinase
MMVNLQEAEAFLVTRFGSDVRGVTSLRQGEWSQAFGFQQGDGDFVVRFSALDEDFQKDRLAMRFRASDLPIPAITEIGEALGGYYAISQRAPGGYLDDLDAKGMRAALPSLLATLDAMRLADCSASQGFGAWDAIGNAPWPTWRDALLDVARDHPGERIHGWRARLEQSPTGAAPFDAAFACLRQLTRILPEERHLIHSDLLNFNVLVEGERISAVIDWGCAMYGDFLYDLAWFLFWAPWYPQWRMIDFLGEAERHFDTMGLAVPNLEERLRYYQIHIGLASQAYSAFRGRWDFLAEVAERTLAVANTEVSPAGCTGCGGSATTAS